MGLLDMLQGMTNAPGGQQGGRGGMSPLTMGLLALLAYKTMKGEGPLGNLLGQRTPSGAGTPTPGASGGGGLLNWLQTRLGGASASGTAGTLINGGTAGALIAGVLLAIANLVISAVYFIWTWTNPDLRASLGQRALGLNTLNASDGATLTRPQAVRRWLYLFGLVAFASAMQSALSTTSLGTLGSLIGLLVFAYEIFLLWTTYQSPKKQGYHDVQAGTVVVKRA